MISNVKICHLPSSIRRDIGLQHHTTVLHKLFFEVFALHVEKIVQKAFCKERRSPLPTQTSTINSQSLIASAMFLCHEYDPCAMPSNLYSQVFPRYTCLGPVRRSQADLVAGSFGSFKRVKKLHLQNAPRVTVCSYAPSFLDLKSYAFQCSPSCSRNCSRNCSPIVPRIVPRIVPHSANYH